MSPTYDFFFSGVEGWIKFSTNISMSLKKFPVGLKTAWFSLHLPLKRFRMFMHVQNIGIWRMIQIPHDEDEPPKPTQK